MFGLWRTAGASGLLILTAFLPAAAQTDDAVRQEAGPFTVRALVVARDQAVLSSGIAARIEKMGKRPGERFKRGEILVEFDCLAFEAQRDIGRAEALAAAKQLASLRKLYELNSAGLLDVEIAAANLERAKAQARLHEVSVRRCQMEAPYDGWVVAWRAQPHETVESGDPVIEIIGAENLEVELIVPSHWLRWMKPGQPLTLTVDETGRSLGAEVEAISANVDPVSQTVTVRCAFADAPDDLIPGMSGTAAFPPDAAF